MTEQLNLLPLPQALLPILEQELLERFLYIRFL